MGGQRTFPGVKGISEALDKRNLPMVVAAKDGNYDLVLNLPYIGKITKMKIFVQQCPQFFFNHHNFDIS